MKRSVLLGLFVTASMMASTSFAADTKPADNCDVNIQTINNMKGQLAAKPELSQKAEATVTRALDLKARGQIDNCVAETSQVITELRKTGGNNN